MSEVTEAEYWDCSIEEYHADCPETFSHSEIDKYIESPQAFYQLHYKKTEPKPQRDHFEFGNLVHDLILQNGKEDLETIVDRLVVRIPADVLSKSGSKAGNAWKEFKEENSGNGILLKDKEIDSLSRIFNGVHRNQSASRLIKECDFFEKSIKWIHEHTGLSLRCRTDCFSMRWICDLKSFGRSILTPSIFAKTAFDLGYHRQAAHYQDGVYAMTGEIIPFIFIVIQKVFPYQCEVFKMDDDFIALGREENQNAIQNLSNSFLNDTWDTPTFGKITELPAPRWARN